jgi:ornithine cyclodeaminase
MILLKSEDVKLALPMAETISAMKAAYRTLSLGKAKIPLRMQLEIKPFQGSSIYMPSFIYGDDGGLLTLKTVSVYPENVKKDLPSIHAAVLVFDAETGKIEALLEGSSLTAIRTGAASGAATDILARLDSSVAAIIGAGVQARTQLEAICTVRKITTVKVYDNDHQKAREFANEMVSKGKIPSDLRVSMTADEAVRDADIICTATTSKSPVYNAKSVQPGAHINGIGSFKPNMIENPPELINNSNTFVDSASAVIEEAGEIIEAIKRKTLDSNKLIELGNVILGRSDGRISNDQITFFKSVGVAVQDAYAARLALQKASTLSLGETIDW